VSPLYIEVCSRGEPKNQKTEKPRKPEKEITEKTD
jgi:hypothetical protein